MKQIGMDQEGKAVFEHRGRHYRDNRQVLVAIISTVHEKLPVPVKVIVDGVEYQATSKTVITRSDGVVVDWYITGPRGGRYSLTQYPQGGWLIHRHDGGAPIRARQVEIKANAHGFGFEPKPPTVAPPKGMAKKAFERAAALYSEFNNKPADKMDSVEVSMPSNASNPLVLLGEMTGILYRSDKENPGGGQQFYLHEATEPFPLLLSTADKRTLVIPMKGGGNSARMTIKNGWLVD